VIGLRGFTASRGECVSLPRGQGSQVLGACLRVLTVAIALDRRPYWPGKRNYIPIMIVAVAGNLVLGRHLLSLMAYK
jgi:hypothetical protein